MKKVRVKEVQDKYVYVLEDKDGRNYRKNIEFYDTEIHEGDYIYISDDVLKEINLYAYGPIQEDASVEDLIKIIHNDKEIYLQRYYG